MNHMYSFVYDRLYHRLSGKLVTYIEPHLSRNDHVLDIGSGNGYVAKKIIDNIRCHVTCLDVMNLNKIGPEPIIYNGHDFPFPDKHFSASIILFCLHHAHNKERILKEAKRVTKSKIIIMEDYAENIYDRTLNLWHRWVSLIKFHSSYIKYLNDIQLRNMFYELGLEISQVRNIPRKTNPTHPTRKIMYVLNMSNYKEL